MATAIVFICLTPIVAFLGYFITKKLIEKQLKENPPISEAQIRAMFQSMGRKPSEAQIRNVMQSMKNAKRRDKYSKRK
ncbi:MAG: YneF family protein [Mycoplasmataceae bacterium]|nr:YneF family protein [Mycoplasmataceae bacterium]